MSIKSDKWIRKMSAMPSYALFKEGHLVKVLGSDEALYISKQIELGLIREPYSISEATPEIISKFNFKPMIAPFENNQVREVDGKKVISYGLSSYGYDVRLGNKFKIFTNVHNSIIDPLNPDDNCFVDHEGDFCIIPPNSYILGHTIETFCIPDNVMTIALGKSTYARSAAIINVTPIEPGFEGQVVIEIANASTLPLKVYAGMGIAQFLFFESDEKCETTYRDRAGKYQGQMGVVTSRI